MKNSRTRGGLALAGVATLAALSGPMAGVALADPPSQTGGHAAQAHDKNAAKKQSKSGKKTPGHGKHGGQHQNQGKHLGQQQGQQQGKHLGQQGGAHGSQGTAGQGAAVSSQASAVRGAESDPPGNNGTVKIAGPGDAAGRPSNNPHPGCTFFVEWFGYDRGSDVVSTVSFTPQAPTRDVTIGNAAPAQVFVGADPAGGGTDLDGRQAYALTFTGTPHPKQGYHVKVTVRTPRSLGNDTKTKVFWVEPCDGATTTSESRGSSDTGLGLGTYTSSDVRGSFRVGTGMGTGTGSGTGSGTERSEGPGVPTAVDAGEGGAFHGLTRSPLGLVVAAGGAALLGTALVRRRSRA